MYCMLVIISEIFLKAKINSYAAINIRPCTEGIPFSLLWCLKVKKTIGQNRI